MPPPPPSARTNPLEFDVAVGGANRLELEGGTGTENPRRGLGQVIVFGPGDEASFRVV